MCTSQRTIVQPERMTIHRVHILHQIHITLITRSLIISCRDAYFEKRLLNELNSCSYMSMYLVRHLEDFCLVSLQRLAIPIYVYACIKNTVLFQVIVRLLWVFLCFFLVMYLVCMCVCVFMYVCLCMGVHECRRMHVGGIPRLRLEIIFNNFGFFFPRPGFFV